MPHVIKLSNKVDNMYILSSLWFILPLDALLIGVAYLLSKSTLSDIQTMGCFQERDVGCVPLSQVDPNFIWAFTHLHYIVAVAMVVLVPLQLVYRKHIRSKK